MRRSEADQTGKPVLVIAYHYPPDRAAGAARPSHFTKYLQRQGYDVTVVTAAEQKPGAPRNVIHVPSPKRGFREKVLRKFLFPYDESMLWAVAALPAASEIAAGSPGLTVFSTFPPVNTHLIALWLKRRFNVRWVADFRDPLANSPVRLVSNQSLSFPHGPVWVDGRIENLVFRWADRVIANSDVVADMWRQRHPQWKHKIDHIWNGFDADEWMPALPLPPRKHKLMVHVGGIFKARHPGMLLASMDRLSANGSLTADKFRLRLVGFIEDGAIPDSAVLERLVKAGAVDVVGSLPKTQAMNELSTSDYLLLLDVNDFDAGQQVPSKLFEYIQIGRPVMTFTPLHSPTHRILIQSGIPHVAIPKNTQAEDMDRKLLDFIALPADPVPPAEWFLSEFDAAARVKKLAAVIESCAPSLQRAATPAGD